MLEYFPRIQGLGCCRGSGAPGASLAHTGRFLFKQMQR